jgi:DNA-binding transcriptional LysR family regulator
LISRRLTALPRVAVASPSYLARRGRPGRPADLAAHDVVQTPVSSVIEWTSPLQSTPERVVPLHTMTTNSSEIARQAALTNMGIAILPCEFVEGDLRAGLLERVLPAFGLPDDEREVSLVYSGRRYLSAKTRSFIDFAVAYYRDPVWTASPERDSVVEEHGMAA